MPCEQAAGSTQQDRVVGTSAKNQVGTMMEKCKYNGGISQKEN